MKKFLALAALVLGMVSCQTEPEGFDVNVGGEQDVNITVSLPEGTRAGYRNSALGAFENVDFTKYDVRFQCEVHYGTEKKVLPVQYGRGDDAVATATFPVRLIANRSYTFVVWADLVEEGSEVDLHYNTANGLDQIEINDWKAMDESRDAYTCTETRFFDRANGIDGKLTLTRPFAKLRVVTTDMNELMGVEPTQAEVVYTTEYRNSFNAVTGKAGDVYSTKTHELFDIASYNESGDNKTLFADYLFVAENDIVNFFMKVYDQNGDLIDEQKNFNTAIPVQRNYVTTIKGNILTYADHFTVEIDPAFANAGNIEEQPFHQVAVTNGADFLKAVAEGREIIALNNFDVTEADATFVEATRSAAKNPVLNLNGCTITVKNTTGEALVNLNGGALKVEGAGEIKANGALVETIYNAGEATIADNAATEPVVNCLSEIRAAFANGDEYTLVCDFAISESLTLAADKTLTLNLNGKTLTGYDKGTASYGLIVNKGNLTVKNGTITLVAENDREWNAYSSVISNNPGGNLVVENVTIEHFGGTSMAYGIDNLTNGKGTYAETTVNNGAVVKSTYRAIRQFLNGIEAQNILTVKAGAVVEGANKSIWMQDPSAKANTGKLVVEEGATLCGDVYLFVTAGSTEWPVEVSIASTAVRGEVLTGNVPAGYEVVEVNGVWTVVAYEYVAEGLYKKDAKTYLVMNAEGLVALAKQGLKSGNAVELGANIDLTGVEFNGLDTFHPENGNTFDGKGYTVSNWTNNSGASDMGFIRNWVGTVKNVNFENCHLKTSGRSAIAAAKVYGNIENVKINNCSIEDSYWACGLVAGLYNAGNISNCVVTNSSVKSNGGTGAIVGVINESAGTRKVENCKVEGCTVNNTGAYGEVYSGALVCGMVNISNSTVEFNGCSYLNNTKEGKYVGDLYYSVDSDIVVKIDDVTVVGSQDALVAALNAGGKVTVAAGEYTFPASSVKAGQTLVCQEGVVFTGTSSLNINGATVVGATFKNEGGQAVSGTIYGTFKSCTFIGEETLRWCYTTAGQTSVFEDCVIKTTLRGFHFDEMNGDVTFRNCEINGFNAYSGAGTMTFEGCTFGNDASNYNGLNIYTNTNVVNSTFNFVSGKTNFIDMEGTGKTLKITNCTATLDGVAKNVVEFVGGSKLADNTVVIK